MTRRELVIDLYKKGHTINYITKKIYNNLNKDFFRDLSVNKYINKKNYKDVEFCRNMVESTILEHISTQKETQFPL